MRPSRRLPLEELTPCLFEPPEVPAPADWHQLFGNEHPVEIEVGFGKGLFLLNASLACPAVNFLGIEIVRKYQLFTATRLVKRAVRNVRLVKADARLFLRDYVASRSVQAVHVYFPDPWWKKRHLKRRLFTAEFVVQCERVLCPEGRLYMVTDVEDYFAIMKDLLAEHTHLRQVALGGEKEPAHDLDYLTNFERKFRKEGRPIYRATYEKPRIPT